MEGFWILILYVAVLILQVLMLMSCIKKKQNKKWYQLFVMEIASIIGVFFILGYFDGLKNVGDKVNIYYALDDDFSYHITYLMENKWIYIPAFLCGFLLLIFSYFRFRGGKKWNKKRGINSIMCGI